MFLLHVHVAIELQVKNPLCEKVMGVWAIDTPRIPPHKCLWKVTWLPEMQLFKTLNFCHVLQDVPSKSFLNEIAAQGRKLSQSHIDFHNCMQNVRIEESRFVSQKVTCSPCE